MDGWLQSEHRSNEKLLKRDNRSSKSLVAFKVGWKEDSEEVKWPIEQRECEMTSM